MPEIFLLICLHKIVCRESKAPPDALLADGKAGGQLWASRAEYQNNTFRTRARLTRVGPRSRRIMKTFRRTPASAEARAGVQTHNPVLAQNTVHPAGTAGERSHGIRKMA